LAAQVKQLVEDVTHVTHLLLQRAQLALIPSSKYPVLQRQVGKDVLRLVPLQELHIAFPSNT